MDTKGQVTQLLNQLADGDRSAFDEVVPLVYEDLRRIARAHMSRQGGAITLNTTGLVHEAYLRLVDKTQLNYNDRDHFLAVYSVVMRNLLVDLARKRKTAKHGGDRVRVTLDDNAAHIDAQADQLLAIDEALAKLAELDERMAKVVECRFFAGLTDAETARALGVTDRTVQRDWAKSKAWLNQWILAG